jgi:hypothetical protein
VAGISAALAWLARGRAVTVLLLGAVIATPLWITRAKPDNDPRVMPISDMTAAIAYVDRMVPPGGPLFVDYETRDVLRYYLSRNDTKLDPFRSETGVEDRLGGYRVVKPINHAYEFGPDDVLEQVTESARALGVPPGDPLWVVSVAWWEPSLASRLPAGGGPEIDAKEFGRISVIKVSGWDQEQVTSNPSSRQQAIVGYGADAVNVISHSSSALHSQWARPD